MQLMAYRACGLEPVKSKTSVSAFLVMVRLTVKTSPLTSMYWRDCQLPSGSSRRRSRSSFSDWSIRVAQASSTVGVAVFVDERHHAVARDVVARDHRAHVEHDHLGRAHHVEERVHHVIAHLALVDDAHAGRAEAFGVDVGRIRAEAAGVGGTDVVDMDEAGAPGDQLALVMDRRHQIDVRGVQRRRVGIVQEIDVALGDAVAEAPDDRLARLGRAGQMMQEADAAHEQRAVRPVERHHEVVALIGDGAARDVLQGDDRLVDDAEQAVADDREGDRIHGAAPQAELDDDVAPGVHAPGLACPGRRWW